MGNVYGLFLYAYLTASETWKRLQKF